MSEGRSGPTVSARLRLQRCPTFRLFAKALFIFPMINKLVQVENLQISTTALEKQMAFMWDENLISCLTPLVVMMR